MVKLKCWRKVKRINKLGKKLGNVEEYKQKQAPLVKLQAGTTMRGFRGTVEIRKFGNKFHVITPSTDAIEKNIKNAREFANRWMKDNDRC